MIIWRDGPTSQGNVLEKHSPTTGGARPGRPRGSGAGAFARPPRKKASFGSTQTPAKSTLPLRGSGASFGASFRSQGSGTRFRSEEAEPPSELPSAPKEAEHASAPRERIHQRRLRCAQARSQPTLRAAGGFRFPDITDFQTSLISRHH